MTPSIATPEHAPGPLGRPSATAGADPHGIHPAAPEFALLRFMAGLRALLALLGSVGFIVHSNLQWLHAQLLLGPYTLWAAFLLWKTLSAWPRASSRLWPWIDAATLLVLSSLTPQSGPLLVELTVLPVVALALIGGVWHAAALATACVAALLFDAWRTADGVLPPLALGIPIVLLALGPAAFFVARPSRELRKRVQLLDQFHARSDPRQGLRHHVNVLLELFAAHFRLTEAMIILQGPQPRIMQWKPGAAARELTEVEETVWRERLTPLPRDMGCLCTTDAAGNRHVAAFDLKSGTRSVLPDAAKDAFHPGVMHAIALPLMSYGQLGRLWLCRDTPAFTAADLRWLQAVMRETLPLLERSDLLEQLQRETASRERERIGRDLHDSAVQPYLGLKYGLEALARTAGPSNPIATNIQELLQMATQELETLRDVVSGLRSGDDVNAESASLVALQRQVGRFQALYGLKVHVFAQHAPHLRGSAARAVLHMVNEALTNIRRHTAATAVTILFEVDHDDVILRLRNDHGVGQPMPRDFIPRSLTERAAEFGGNVTVWREAGFTELVITLPLLGTLG